MGDVFKTIGILAIVISIPLGAILLIVITIAKAISNS
jgi:hypothetical protein